MIFSKNKKKKKSKKGLALAIGKLFSRNGIDEQFYEDLEELMIESDIGGTTTISLIDELQERASNAKIKDREGLINELKSIISESLLPLDLRPKEDKLHLYLILGVNGVGKTTTIAKMAHYFKKNGTDRVIFAAGDTFRAGAIDQLKIQGDRTDCRVVSQSPGSDPGAVIFDAITSAVSKNEQLVLADTAGRMHNRKNLVNELEKIDRIVSGKLGENAIYKKILVIDATTGQNGLQQAETFNDAVNLDGVVLTKYDSTARGGLLVAINRKLRIPCAFLGRGEQLEDLIPFDPEDYLEELLGYEEA